MTAGFTIDEINHSITKELLSGWDFSDVLVRSISRDRIEDHSYLSLGALFSSLDEKHRYKAPHANRPGDRPYERKFRR